MLLKSGKSVEDDCKSWKKTTYCKVPLEGFGSPVIVVSTDLTVVVDVQPMQFIEPVWNWLEGIKQQSAITKSSSDEEIKEYKEKKFKPKDVYTVRQECF